MNHTSRRAAVAARLPGIGAGALLVAHPPNVRYLTGFTGSSSTVLLRPDGSASLFTDGRYVEQAAGQVPDLAIVPVTASPPSAAAAAASGAEPARLCFESSLAYGIFGDLADAAPGLELVAVSGLVEEARLAKDGDELAALAAAQRLTDAGFAAIVPMLEPGRSERDIALELEIAMRRAGADDRAFRPIVASGPAGARPHHEPGERRLARGDLITLDFGATVDGYHADMTRTVALGAPAPRLREVYEVVLASHLAGIDALTPGTTAGEVEAAAHAVVREAGFGDGWLHPPGHGLGLEIHERPILRPGDVSKIPEGAVITIEPGVYVPGVGGVRIEDAVVVGGDGPRPLPSTGKDLLVL